jgi:hypothetical protein
MLQILDDFLRVILGIAPEEPVTRGTRIMASLVVLLIVSILIAVRI